MINVNFVVKRKLNNPLVAMLPFHWLKEWPIKGGQWGSPVFSYSELIITGYFAILYLSFFC